MKLFSKKPRKIFILRGFLLYLYRTKSNKNMDNIGLLHQSCGDKRKQEWQEANKNRAINVNKHCKLSFGEKENVEHMWVLVKEVDHANRKYSGNLDNDPLYTHVHGLNCGDRVEFSFEDIEDYT